MPQLILFGLVAILIWSLVSHRFERWGVAGPIGLVLLGALTVVWDVDAFGTAIDSPTSEKIVEVILAILLFADATEVKGGIFGREGKVIARLVLVALPLSIVLTVAAGLLLLPGAGPFLLLVIACVILPTDFAPAASLLRNRHIPARMRQILNVESGYNDGLISPVFGMSLALAVVWSTISNTPASDVSEDSLDGEVTKFLSAFENAVPSTVIAIVIGIILGAGIGYLVRVAREKRIADALGARYVMLVLPLIAYGVASLPMFNANGFVAAFVAGLGYRLTRTKGHLSDGIEHSELQLVEEVGALTANFVWFVLGGATLVVITSGIDWWMLLLAVLALTLLRIVPVYLSLMRSSVGRGDRLLIGALGPRGTASVVFGLLAYNALPDDEGSIVLTIMVATVFGSIVLHGLAAPLLLKRLRPEDQPA